MHKIQQLASLQSNREIVSVVMSIISPEEIETQGLAKATEILAADTLKQILERFDKCIDRSLFALILDANVGFNEGYGSVLFDKLMYELAGREESPALLLVTELVDSAIWYWACAALAESCEIGNDLQTSMLKTEFFGEQFNAG